LHLPFRVELLLYNNLLRIKLIVLMLTSSFSRFHDDNVSIREMRNIQLVVVSKLGIIYPQIRLIMDVSLIWSHFRIQCSFVEFTIVDDLLVVLNAQFELEHTC